MKRKVILINILLSLLFLEIVSIIVLKTNNVMSLSKHRIISQKEFKTQLSSTTFSFPENFEIDFINLVKDKLTIDRNNEQTIESAIKIREDLLNLAYLSDTTILISKYPDELFLHLISNKKLLCGEIALLYGYILNLSGFDVRYITISRSLFDEYDRHSTIEIWDKKRNKWIISDPTFNITFMSDTTYLSSDELYDLVHSGKYDMIKIVPGNKTKYQLSIDNFYISYFSLLDKIIFVKNIHPFTFNDLPPIRWFVPDYNFFVLKSNKFPIRGASLNIQNLIVFLLIFLIPTIIIIGAIYIIYLSQKEKLFPLNFFTKPKILLVRITRKY